MTATGIGAFHGQLLLVTLLVVPTAVLFAEISLRAVEEPALRRKVPAGPR